MSRLDPTSLKLFISVVEEKTIAAAAAREHIAAAAVSKRLSDIEQALGTPLLRRTNRGVEPTDAGLALLALARNALHELDQIPAQMQSYSSGTRGLVRVCASMSSITQFLPGDIQTFLTTHEGVQVNLDEKISSLVIQSVQENAADIGIYTNVQDTKGLEIYPYRTDHLALIMPKGHPLGKRKAWAFNDTLQHDYVGWQTGSAINQQLTNAAAAARQDWRLKIRVSSFDALCMMVSSGLGVGVLPEAVARRNANNLNIEIRQLTDPWATREFKICVRSISALTTAAKMMVDHLTQIGSR